MTNRSENLAGRDQVLTILAGNRRSIAQKSGEIWAGQADLQSISFKSDRLLGPRLPYNRAMKLRIVAVGNRLPEWVYAGFAEYARRFPPELPLTLTEIRAEKRAAGLEPAALIRREGERVLASLSARDTVIALDEHGEQISTRQLAERLQRWREAGADATFLIGGADGLDATVKARAAAQFALSRLTLPHGLARVLLAEQLYRAYSLLQGHPYHRE